MFREERLTAGGTRDDLVHTVLEPRAEVLDLRSDAVELLLVLVERRKCRLGEDAL